MLEILVFVLVALSAHAAALPNEPYIMYSNITNLHVLDLNTFVRTDVLGGLDRAIPLGFDSVNQDIYFGEHSLGKIYRANYDGTSKKLLVEDVENIEGVAIDWIGRNMYWTTYQSETIEVSKIDGRYRKVLLNTELEYPRGLAVDPVAGYLFWSDWGTQAAIERCALDGTGRVALVTKNITWPNGITLDTNAKKVFWIDADHDTISCVDYDGNNRKLIFQDSSLALSKFHGFDLDFSGNSMYFTDWLNNAIYGIKISTGVEFINISVPTSNFIKGAMGLRVIDGSKQQTGTSNCGNNNGGCEQLCFHKVPSGTSCGCELGMKLADDGKSCEDAFKDEFLMFADADAGKIYQMQLDDINVRPIAVPFDGKTNISRPVALEYDRVEDRVYWSDVTLKIICRAFRNGTGFEVLFDDIGVADGLTIDFAGRQLYWTSETNNTVETSKLDGSHRKILIRWNLDSPRDIIVDPVDGYMYWTDWGHFPRIERAYMNGENRMDLVNTTLYWPNGLTIDHVYNTLYWADAYEDNIERMDLVTLKRKVVLNKKFLIFGFLFPGVSQVNHPYGLTSLHDHLYWTDWSTSSVYRADTNTGANIRVMASGLGKPMDIHAYRAMPKPQNKTYYTFSFPQHGSNFSCISSTQCPQINEPPPCPSGYTEVRINSTCGLYCREIVGYTYRCPCNDWMSCAVKERYLFGCRIGYYTSFRVRECAQVVRPGRCPSSGGTGSQQACNSDAVCPSEEKCCNSKCVQTASTDKHPCQQNNGGCEQLCFAVPGGHKCGCKNGYFYNDTTAKCEMDTRPTIPPPTPPPEGCAPHPAPEHGSVDCDGDGILVPEWGHCWFSCDPGYELVGYAWDWCYNGEWIDPTPTCNISSKPTFSHCPNDTTVPTDSGKSYATVNWKMPTATDKDGVNLKVDIWPSDATPPARFEIGWHWVDLTVTDKDGEYAYCYFYIIVEDREPPSFGSTCPNNLTLHTENDFAIRLPQSFKEPNATDNSKHVTVDRQGFPTDSFFPIGTTVVSYTARDYSGLNATCIFSVSIINVCAGVTCTHGAKCTLDTRMTSHMCACNSLCPQNYDPVCGSDGQTYNNDCLMNVSQCTTSKTITAVKKGKCSIDHCSALKCGFGAVCKVVDGVAKCSCDDLTCADAETPVCGSDGKTYDYRCLLLKEQCAEQTTINVIHDGECGCDDLKPSEDGFETTSTMSCRYDQSYKNVKCNVSCQSGNNAVFPEFLKIQCYRGQWIRSNKEKKFVRLAYAHSPPKCYKPTNKTSSRPYCSSGNTLMKKDKCVPCPPGSYEDGNNCISCPVTEYQDNAGQTECKKCASPNTSTVTGAEDCYFNHGKSAVGMILENKQVEKDKISEDIAAGLTTLCNTANCSFVDNTARRRKRDAQYDFKAEHVIIISIEQSNTVNPEVQLFVLDPSSSSLLPDKAFSSEVLKDWLNQMKQKNYLTYVKLKFVYTLPVGSPSKGETSKGEKSSSKAPLVAGVVIAIIVIIGVLFAVLVYHRRRKSKSSVPPVQFHSSGDGGMHIGSPTPGASNLQYENSEHIREGLQKGFVNKVYDDVSNAPPPYSVNTPVHKPAANPGLYQVPHVYETPDGDQAGALPAKEKLPDGAVVDVIPDKSDGYEVPIKAENPVKFFHKRSLPNSYEVPKGAQGNLSATPDTEAELRLEPPPKLDDAKLQVIRGKAASLILPNVPRKKKIDPVVDANANESKGDGAKSHYQNVSDVTKEQSET